MSLFSGARLSGKEIDKLQGKPFVTASGLLVLAARWSLPFSGVILPSDRFYLERLIYRIPLLLSSGTCYCVAIHTLYRQELLLTVTCIKTKQVL